ncbi:MAG: helix-turn-helix domain-containing protein [Defluviitaleaceae bacterium]|nr:helix-turn-helix domain-containing protein [Defluviitaleaceae bacterium]
MKIDTKDQLLKEFLEFDLLENQKLGTLIKRIERYLAKSTDADLNLASNVLKTVKADNDQQSFDACCAIATSVFQQLEATNPWTHLDMFSLSTVIGHASSVSQTLALYEEMTDLIMDDHADDIEFKKIHYIAQYNLTLRLLRAKYLGSDVEMSKVDELFKSCYDYTLKIAKKNNSPMEHVLNIRYGIYIDKQKIASEEMLKLQKFGDRKLYRFTRDEIVEFLSYMNTRVRAPLSYILAGSQIRKRRIERDMSTMDLAAVLGTEQSAISAIERGDDGASLDRLQAIAEILDVKVGYFLGDESQKIEKSDPFLRAIEAETSFMEEDHKQFLLKLVRAYSESHYPNRGKLKEKPQDLH